MPSSLKWARIRASRRAREARVDRELAAYAEAVTDLPATDARVCAAIVAPTDLGQHATLGARDRILMADRLAADWVSALPDVFKNRTPLSAASAPCVIAGVDFSVARRILSPTQAVFKAMVRACYAAILRVSDPQMVAIPKGAETTPLWRALSHALDALDAYRVASLWEEHYPGTVRMVLTDRCNQMLREYVQCLGKLDVLVAVQPHIERWRRTGFCAVNQHTQALVISHICIAIPGDVPGQPALSDVLVSLAPDSVDGRAMEIRQAAHDALAHVHGQDIRAWAEASAYLVLALSPWFKEPVRPDNASSGDSAIPLRESSGEGGYDGPDENRDNRAVVQDAMREARSAAAGISEQDVGAPVQMETGNSDNSRREDTPTDPTPDPKPAQMPTQMPTADASGSEIAAALLRVIEQKDAAAAEAAMASEADSSIEALDELDTAFRVTPIDDNTGQPTHPSAHAQAIASILRQIRGRRTVVASTDGVDILEERLIDLRTDPLHADPRICVTHQRNSQLARVLLLVDVSSSVKSDPRLRSALEQVSTDLSAALRKNRCRLDMIGYSANLYRYLDGRPPLYRAGVVAASTRTIHALRYAGAWASRIRADRRTIFVITDGDPTDGGAPEVLRAIRDLDNRDGVRVLFVIITQRKTADSRTSSTVATLLSAKGYPIHGVGSPAELYRVLLKAIRGRRFL